MWLLKKKLIQFPSLGHLYIQVPYLQHQYWLESKECY